MAFCTLIFTYFIVPECQGKSLEDIDIMFQERVPLRQFGAYQPEQRLGNISEKGSVAGSPDVESVGVQANKLEA